MSKCLRNLCVIQRLFLMWSLPTFPASSTSIPLPTDTTAPAPNRDQLVERALLVFHCLEQTFILPGSFFFLALSVISYVGRVLWPLNLLFLCVDNAWHKALLLQLSHSILIVAYLSLSLDYELCWGLRFELTPLQMNHGIQILLLLHESKFPVKKTENKKDIEMLYFLCKNIIILSFTRSKSIYWKYKNPKKMM